MFFEGKEVLVVVLIVVVILLFISFPFSISPLTFFNSLLASLRNFIHTSHSATFLETPKKLTFLTSGKKEKEVVLSLVMLEEIKK